MEVNARIIHSDIESGRFLVLVTELGSLAYSHWRPFQLAGHPVVRVGEGFSVELEYDRRDNETLIVRKVVGTCAPPNIRLNELGSKESLNTDRRCSEAEVLDAIKSEPDITVARNLSFDTFEQSSLEIYGSVVFANCHFHEDFRWLQARVRGSLWFLNCSFGQHFSLKSAVLNGSAIFFGCDFAGFGGISFRGIQASSLLLEFGTRGSDDMLWLNEMSLRGCLAINGSFDAPVQLLAQQDDTPVNRMPGLGRVFIGCQSYQSEQLSRNQFAGGIFIEGYRLSGELEVRRSQVGLLSIADVTTVYAQIDHCELQQDLLLNDITMADESRGVAITNTVIGRHLRVSGPYLRGLCNFEGTSVGQAWTMELEYPEKGTPRMRLDKFHAEQAWFDPINLVYGDTPVRRMAKPPSFGLLDREHSTGSTAEDRRHLAEAYTKFKNWMADTGHLREEDHAFFHMRHYKESRCLTRYLLGGVFGWGIRFRNILMSALLVSVLCAVAYSVMGLSPDEAVMLSLQAFISSFFGRWPDTDATGLLSMIVTLESMVGVLFVTVLIGAYIRKLLR